jgi:hypothetical protein
MTTTDKWFKDPAAKEWIADKITKENISQAEGIINDDMMMKLAACCTAVYEGFSQGSEFKQRVSQILSSEKECHSAAMFLVYQNTMKQDGAPQIDIQFYNNNNTNKERSMDEQKTEKALTENQVKYASNNKQRVLQEVDEFKQYLQKQDNPEWWVKRRFFSFAANSFNKYKRDSFQQQQKQSLTTENNVAEAPQIKQKI